MRCTEWLAAIYDRISASLIIAAFLLVAAAGCALWATLLRKTTHHPIPTNPVAIASLRPSRSTMLGLAAGGALSAALAAFGLIRRYRRR